MLKTGPGTLALTNSNSIVSQTRVDAGTLLVNGSNTGSGAVQVTNGTLGGSGSITGAVTIGNGTVGNGTVAVTDSSLAPGKDPAKTADPDNDGNNNLAEFAFDGDPLSGANDGKIVGKVATVGDNPVMTLTLPVRAVASFSPNSGDQLSLQIDGLYYRTFRHSGTVPATPKPSSAPTPAKHPETGELPSVTRNLAHSYTPEEEGACSLPPAFSLYLGSRIYRTPLNVRQHQLTKVDSHQASPPNLGKPLHQKISE